ncbi:sugar ABC transporter ATP-binding protein [Bacillota bacterium Meth-B3]
MIKESLELKHVSKVFGGIKAVCDISFTLHAGTIYGLAGENGAGKSTTMKIINGAYVADGGAILIDGKETAIASPLDAQRLGISMVYQELNMLPDLSVTENIFISHLTDSKVGYIKWNELHKRARALLDSLDLDIDPRVRLGNLKVAQQQLVAIVRALSRDCKLIILDEPTSALTDKDSEIVNRAVRKLKELGYIVVYVTHKLGEMLSVTDEVIVFKNGEKIGQYDSGALTVDTLAEMIAGRKLSVKFPKKRFPRGDEILRAEHVTVDGLLEDVSFTLYKGEILGFAGLLGAGKSEVAKLLFGVFGTGGHKISGRIFYEGREVNFRDPRGAIAANIGLVPENRGSEGLVTNMSIFNNILIPVIDRQSKLGIVDDRAERRLVERMICDLEIKCAGERQTVGNLSGGNQQKVVLAKWIAAGSRVIIFDEPTRGIDVGAKVAFYNMMNDLVEAGVGVIITSSELEEVYSMSDTLVILKEKRISGVIDTRDEGVGDISKLL